MNLTQIRDQIATQLTIADYLTATSRIPGSGEITCPHAFISDMALRPVAMGDAVDIEFEVTVLVSLGDADGWDTISYLCDIDADGSIVDALLEDRTLDGLVHSMTFTEIRGLGGNFEVAGITYMGFQMTFTVHR